MYEWLTERIEQAKRIFHEFSLDWTFVLHEPANETQIRACELELGVILPPSYREFLLQYNGAYLFCEEDRERSVSSSWWADSGLFIQGTDTLLLWNQAVREGYDLEEWDSLVPFCYLGRIGTGDFCALDPQQLEDLEYAVLDCDHDYRPSEWRKARVASSFEDWLQKIFDQVIEQKKFPEYWFNTADSSTSNSLAPEKFAALLRQGRKKAQRGEYAAAIADFNQILQLNPQHDAYYERGNIHFAQGNYQEALEDYNQALLLNPQSVIACNQRGLARFELGDHQGALEAYNQALQLNSSFVEAYVNRGSVRSRLGDTQGALEDCQRADALKSIGFLEEIELESITCTLIQGQEAIIANSDDFFESDEESTSSDEREGFGEVGV